MLNNREGREITIGVGGDVQPKQVTAATTLDVRDQIVHVTPPASSTYVVTLPAVAEAAGRTYYIVSTSDATGTFTVADQDDARESGGNYTSDALTTTGDYVLLYCTGDRYIELSEETT